MKAVEIPKPHGGVRVLGVRKHPEQKPRPRDDPEVYFAYIDKSMDSKI